MACKRLISCHVAFPQRKNVQHHINIIILLMLIHAVVRSMYILRSRLSLFEESLGIFYTRNIFVYYKFIRYKHTFRMF
jgi:hypothetical protein